MKNWGKLLLAALVLLLVAALYFGILIPYGRDAKDYTIRSQVARLIFNDIQDLRNVSLENEELFKVLSKDTLSNYNIFASSYSVCFIHANTRSFLIFFRKKDVKPYDKLFIPKTLAYKNWVSPNK